MRFAKLRLRNRIRQHSSLGNPRVVTVTFGAEGPNTISVATLDSNRVLAEIIERHGGIDLLKIDIERLEYRITARIPPDVARKIRRIVVERHFHDNPLASTHEMSYRRPITTFLRRTCD